jgi:hypothetical protein
MLLLVSLNNFSGLKIFYESERIIELSNESQDIIDKSLDDMVKGVNGILMMKNWSANI